MPEGRRPSLGETFSEVAALVHAQQAETEAEDGNHVSYGSLASTAIVANTSTTTTTTQYSTSGSSTKYGFVRHEVYLFLQLALPTCLLNVGMNLSTLLTASVVGLRFGKLYLSAFTLANLTGNLCTFSLLWGLFSAADTLSPQAYGKGNYPDLGYQAMRGMVLAIVIIVPPNILFVWRLDQILIWVGQDATAAQHAHEWYRIFVFGLPFSVVFTAAWKFLSAQHVMMPLMGVSLFSCVLILPLALEVFSSKFGFVGSAMAYVTFQATQATLLLTYCVWKTPHVPESWPGIWCRQSWRQALQWDACREYAHLAAGGMLAQSEWIFWEALGLIIGQLGVLELSVHTIPNQLVMLACLAPFAFGTALAIRMGITLSSSKPHNHHHQDGRSSGAGSLDTVRKTQRMVVLIISLSLVIFGVVAIGMYLYRQWIYSFFTTEAQVIGKAEQIWWKVCLFSFNVAIFALFTGVATGLGMQWSLGAVNFGFLWLFGVPVTYYSTIVLRGGLEAAWTWINVPYVMMNATLLGIFLMTDWYQIQDKILSGDIVMDPELQKPTPAENGALHTARTGEKAELLHDDNHRHTNYAGV